MAVSESTERQIVRNRVNRMIKADQRNYKGRIINSFKSNPKKFYGYMRRTQTVKVQVAQLERKDDTLTLPTMKLHLSCAISSRKFSYRMRCAAKCDTKFKDLVPSRETWTASVRRL